MKLEISVWAELAGYFTVLAGFCAGIWRFCVLPSLKGMQAVRARYISLVDVFALCSDLLSLCPPGSSPSLSELISEGCHTAGKNVWAVRAVMQELGVAFFECDKSGLCTYVNPHWSRLFGVSATNAIGLGWKTGISDEDRDRVSDEWRAAAGEFREFSMVFVTSTGARVRARSYVCRVSGKVIGFIGVVSEVGAENQHKHT